MPLTRIRQTAIGNDSITSAKLAHDLDLDGDFVRVPHGTTAQRPSSPVNGYLRYNTDFERLEQYADGQWQSIDTPPSITSLSYPSPVTAANPAGGETITLTGSNFQSGATVTVGGTSSPTVSVVSSTSITFVTPAKTAGDYDVKVTNGNGLSATLTNGLTVNGVPSFTTAANLGNIAGSTTISNLTIVAAETDGGTVSYSISTPASPDFVSINSGTGVLSGTTPAPQNANTAYNFTVTATDDENQTNTRTYTLTVLGLHYNYNIPTSLSFTAAEAQRIVLDKSGGTDGDRKTWTLSMWVKRSSLTDGIIWSHGGNSSGEGFLRIKANGALNIVNDGITNGVDGTIPLSDTNSWYHIVWATDSRSSANGGPATADGRTRIWINGYETTNAEQGSPSNTVDGAGYIGYYSGGMDVCFGDRERAFQQSGNSPIPFDGEIAEVHFVEGQQLTAATFGQTRNGYWVPKEVTGITYGTNGYYLPLREDTDVELFNTGVYKGVGGSTSTTPLRIGNLGFEPGWVFMTSTTTARNINVHDVVRGNTKYIALNSNAIENTSDGAVMETGEDYFTVGTAGGYNTDGEIYHYYAFNTPNTTQSLSTGDINSTVSANSTYGLSVVKYQGNGSTGQRVPHGLSSAPTVIWIKNLTTTYNWDVFFDGVTGTDERLSLSNINAVVTTQTGMWGTHDSSHIVVGGSSYNNNNTSDYIAYCMHSVANYSAFGTYSGNTSTLPSLNLGFRPALVIIKSHNTGSRDWLMYSSPGNGYTGDTPTYAVPILGSQTTYGGSYNEIQFTANGFDITGSSSPNFNGNGEEYIYMAWADTSAYRFFKDDTSNNNDFIGRSGLGSYQLRNDTPTGNY